MSQPWCWCSCHTSLVDIQPLPTLVAVLTKMCTTLPSAGFSVRKQRAIYCTGSGCRKMWLNITLPWWTCVNLSNLFISKMLICKMEVLILSSFLVHWTALEIELMVCKTFRRAMVICYSCCYCCSGHLSPQVQWGQGHKNCLYLTWIRLL